MERKNTAQNNTKQNNEYDDGNIPDIDLPQNSVHSVESLPENSRPRKDGTGGESGN